MIRTALLITSMSLILSACGASGSKDEAVITSELSEMDRGAILYKQRCRTCHTLNDGGRHRVGPNLWGVLGATAGTKEGFNYSNAMAMSEIIWTDETLSAYLEKPQTFIKGNRMSFAGFRFSEDRKAIIAYLKANTGAEDTQLTAPDQN